MMDVGETKLQLHWEILKKIGCSTFTITVHYHDDKRVYSTGVKDKLFSGGLERKYKIWVPENKYVDYFSLNSEREEILRYNLDFDSEYGLDVLISLDFRSIFEVE